MASDRFDLTGKTALITGAAGLLGPEHAEVLLAQFYETAVYRRWQLLAVAIMNNHVHLVVAVADDPDPARVLGDFKAYGSRALNKRFGRPASGSWWTSRGSQRKLHDQRVRSNAIHYVLHKQPNPLLTWSPDKSPKQ